MTKSERARKRLEVTAYHEAGHAVAAFNVGRSFRHVTIEPGDESLGHLLHDRFSRSFKPDIAMSKRTEATIEDHVLIGMAGMAAERRFVGRSRRNWRGGRQDMDNAI